MSGAEGLGSRAAAWIGGVALEAMAIWTFAFLLGWAGCAVEAVRHHFALLVLALSSVALFGARMISWPSVLSVAAAITVLVAGDEATAGLAFALGWFAMRGSHSAVPAALLLSSVVVHAVSLAPELSEPLHWVAALLSDVATPPGASAGPTPLGVWPWATAVAAIAVSIRRRHRNRVLGGLAMVTVTGLMVWHAAAFAVPEQAERFAAQQAFAWLPWLACAIALVAAMACVSGTPDEAPQIGLVALAVPAIAGAVLGVVSSMPLLVSPEPKSRIGVWNEGGLDWNRPVFGKYGVMSSGMFGLLPEYLRRDGFEFCVLSGDLLTRDQLQNLQTLVLINCPRDWTAAERTEIRAFVERGGSLLVLGDHTDVFSLKKGFDTLTPEYGIRFRYDSAYHVIRPWSACMRIPRHPVTTLARNEFADSHGIGATLECEAAVMPLLRAPYSFSDIGIPQNKMGSYLGNYAYEAGEPIGDLDLIAWRDVGRGKIVVYGDTSAFQNGAVALTYEDHTRPLFRWLAAPTHWSERRFTRLTCAVLLGLLGLWLAARGRRRQLATLGGGLCVALVAVLLAARGQVVHDATGIDADHVVIDYTCIPWTGHYEAKVNSIGPLYTYLARAGFIVRKRARRDDMEWRTARALVMVAPMRRLDDPEVDELLRYQESGGVVILCVGDQSRGAAEPLLHAAGIDVAPVPLGPLPPRMSQRAENMTPRLVSAWPIVGFSTNNQPGPLPPGTDELFGYDQFVNVAFVPRGDGGLLVIGDQRFFSDTNIEGRWGHWPGNARFLYSVFRDYLNADPDAVADLFPSPEMPR